MQRNFTINREALVCPSLSAPDQRTRRTGAPLIEPPLAPRDEAALLLTVVAEIEHALMVQYLYAAYSVRDDQPNHAQQAAARSLQAQLVQIAREEMGHLLTAQNLLNLVGASFHLQREHSPFESALYPFRFKLERLSQGSLAKYVTAERPAMKPAALSDDEWARLEQIERDARTANDEHPVQHVGAIFERLIELFEDPINGVGDGDLQFGHRDRQATWQDWGYDDSIVPNDDSRTVVVASFEGQTADDARKRALQALHDISEQGEGFGDHVDSHFERFYQLLRDFEALEVQGFDFVWPVATNPHTAAAGDSLREDGQLDAARTAALQRGYISFDRSRQWADLFNARYRLLLSFLSHFLHIAGPRYIATGPDKGDRTPRGFLLLWSFDEMRHLRKIAQKLAAMPLRHNGDEVHAGPPFQMPYTVAIPTDERLRWRAHRDVVIGSRFLLDDVTAAGSLDAADPFLLDLRTADLRLQSILDALSRGDAPPSDAHFTNFQKAAHILEEAVRGFNIQGHQNFWSGMNRDEFVNLHMFNTPFLARDTDDGCKFVANGSQLLSRLTTQGKPGRMPRFRPNIDPSRQQFYSDWVDAQCPDNDPPGQVGVRTEQSPTTEPG